MKRILSVFAVAAGLSLAADTAHAQAPSVVTAPAVRYYAPAPATAGTYYYRNGAYYYTRSPVANYYAPASPGYYTWNNGVARGPSGAMTGRASHNFDPTGRPVQLYKPWLQPLR